MSNGVLFLPAGVTAVPLDGVYDAVFDLFHDPYMIGLPVLGTGFGSVIPIEKDDHAGGRRF